jgi:hypothetical protein
LSETGDQRWQFVAFKISRPSNSQHCRKSAAKERLINQVQAVGQSRQILDWVARVVFEGWPASNGLAFKPADGL